MSDFESAVKAIPALASKWCKGLSGLNATDRGRIDSTHVKLAGSVDVDDACKSSEPQSPRWDYGIGVRRSKGDKDKVYWVEVHPCKDGEVGPVLAKLAWLHVWLQKTANRLDQLDREFVWVSTNATTITKNSPKAKQLAKQGLRLAGRRLVLQA